jgi:hypothetical protein
MGNWTLESLHTDSTPMNGGVFGTNFHATFLMRYTTSTFGLYQETPQLDWHETIMMNEYHKQQCWVFDTNMYTHNPGSNTLVIWARRYIEAYRTAGNLGSMIKGKSQLTTSTGADVTIQDLGANLTDSAQQADAVRSYLKRKGGCLVIAIHDIPGIHAPTGTDHKERLLLFNIGVLGVGVRRRAEQYLNVQAGVHPVNWQREFSNIGWTRTRLNTTGLQTVPPPPAVALGKPPQFLPGECW